MSGTHGAVEAQSEQHEEEDDGPEGGAGQRGDGFRVGHEHQAWTCHTPSPALSTLHTVQHGTQYATHCTTRHSVRYTLYNTALSTLHTVQHGTQYATHCTTRHSVRYTLYNTALSTLHTVQHGTQYTTHCTTRHSVGRTIDSHSFGITCDKSAVRLLDCREKRSTKQQRQQQQQ